MKPANPPIGDVECPHKGCSQRCKVYAFRPRTGGRRSVFTGKKYLVCPDHGRIGADGSQRITDYILEKGKIWGAKKPENAAGNTVKAASTTNSGTAATPKPAPAPKPDQRPAVRRKVPESKPENPQSKPKWWETLI